MYDKSIFLVVKNVIKCLRPVSCYGNAANPNLWAERRTLKKLLKDRLDNSSKSNDDDQFIFNLHEKLIKISRDLYMDFNYIGRKEIYIQ